MPDVQQIRLEVEPATVVADGASFATASVRVTADNGDPAGDGTSIVWMVDGDADVDPQRAETENGYASARVTPHESAEGGSVVVTCNVEGTSLTSSAPIACAPGALP